ncbi:MAG: hypothetical protein AB1758_34435 [Candidatus Eremiobacterota bacterium]
MISTLAQPTLATRPSRGALPVEGSKLHPNMAAKLGQYIGKAVLDGQELLRDDAAEWLVSRGFEPERREPGVLFSYTLGNASLYGTGQRVIFFEKDRTVALMTFADQWVQQIRMGPDGKVLVNQVERIPH